MGAVLRDALLHFVSESEKPMGAVYTDALITLLIK